MKTSIFILSIGFSFLTWKASAQQLPLGSHYFMNPFMVNPAYTGSQDQLSVFLTHRSQFSEIAGSPQTTYLTLDGPISGSGIGLGLKAYADVTSILSRNGISGNYSYTLNLGDGHTLSFGIAAGVIDHTINYDQAIVRDLDDPSIFEQKVHRTVFNADFGLMYEWNKWQVGFAIPQFLGNKSRFRNNDGTISYFDMQRHYVGSAKYLFEIDKKHGINVYPMVLVRGVSGAPVQYDISVVGDWTKHGWVALNYRSNYAIGVSVGVRYNGLSVGYSNDFGVNKLRSYAGSTHEFLLSYQLGNDTKKRLDQHDRELEELRQRVDITESDIDRLDQEIMESKKNEQELTANLDALKMQMEDSIAALRNQLNNQMQAPVKPASTTSSEKGNFRTYGSADFLDENGNPLPVGYYVVIGSFSVPDNAVFFQEEVEKKGEQNVAITFHTSISIYNVYVLQSDNYQEAHKKRMELADQYANTWVLKLE